MNIRHGEKLFEFASKQAWIQRASSIWRRHGVRADDTLCVDQLGRICTIGAHFTAAEADGAYPIEVFRARPASSAGGRASSASRPPAVTAPASTSPTELWGVLRARAGVARDAETQTLIMAQVGRAIELSMHGEMTYCYEEFLDAARHFTEGKPTRAQQRAFNEALHNSTETVARSRIVEKAIERIKAGGRILMSIRIAALEVQRDMRCDGAVIGEDLIAGEADILALLLLLSGKDPAHEVAFEAGARLNIGYHLPDAIEEVARTFGIPWAIPQLLLDVPRILHSEKQSLS